MSKRGLDLSGVALVVAAVAVFAFAGWVAARPVEPATTGPSHLQPAQPSTPTEGADVTREDGEPLRVVFAGDSLTYGLYASTEAKGYRPRVVAAWEQDGPVEWSRGGQTGNRVATVAASLDVPADTDLIVLALGTNDLYKTPVPKFERQYAALVEQVTDAAPDAALACLGVWGNVDASRNYDPAIEEPCADAGGTFVPLSDLFEQERNRGPSGRDVFGGVSDDFHPNDRGYAAIAERLLAAVRVG